MLSRLPLLPILVASTTGSAAGMAASNRGAFAPTVRGFCDVNSVPSSIPISRIGFGTYRIEGRRPEHAEAIKQALLGGINLIDTSANYGDGDSEIQIGEVLRELTEGGQINRNEVLLVSKFGYIQGQNLKRYNSGEVVTPDTVHYADYIKHCIHPDFMRDQLDRSLERLDQDRIDIFLLHNPEYYLHFEVRGEMDEATMDGHRQEMQRRIYEAFKALELEVDAGRIRSYGISSNSFSLAPSDPHFLQYDNLLDLAAEASKEVHNSADAPHHFSTIQLPANLLEQEGLHGAVEWAGQNGVNVLVNRPINAFNDQLNLRLADYPDNGEAYVAARNTLLSYAMEKNNDQLAQAVHTLDEELGTLSSVFIWERYAGQTAVPLIKEGLDAGGDYSEDEVALAQAFIDEMENRIRFFSSLEARERLEELGYAVPQDKLLQDYAISFLLDRSDVTCVLLGARQPEYVTDAIDLIHKYDPTRSFELP